MSVLRCEKCGGSEIQVRFHVGSTYWGDGTHCGHGESANHNLNTRADEHLHYRCQTCLFDWTGDTT